MRRKGCSLPAHKLAEPFVEMSWATGRVRRDENRNDDWWGDDSAGRSNAWSSGSARDAEPWTSETWMSSRGYCYEEEDVPRETTYARYGREDSDWRASASWITDPYSEPNKRARTYTSARKAYDEDEDAWMPREEVDETARYPGWDLQPGAEQSRKQLEKIMWDFHTNASRPIPQALAFWFYNSVYLKSLHFRVRAAGPLEVVALHVVSQH